VVAETAMGTVAFLVAVALETSALLEVVREVPVGAALEPAARAVRPAWVVPAAVVDAAVAAAGGVGE